MKDARVRFWSNFGGGVGWAPPLDRGISQRLKDGKVIGGNIN